MDKVINAREILDLLPHRYPFLLVDRVLSKTYGPDPKSRMGNKVTAIKNVSFNEPFFQGHFPGLPVMPGVLQIEAMAQTACLAVLREGDEEMDFFVASISEAKFRKMVTPGDTLTMYAEITKDRGSIIVLKARAEVAGDVVAEVEMMAKMAPKSKR